MPKVNITVGGEDTSSAPLFWWTLVFHGANRTLPRKDFLFENRSGFFNKTAADRISEYLQYTYNPLESLKLTAAWLMSPIPWMYRNGLRLTAGTLGLVESTLECVEWFSKKDK